MVLRVEMLGAARVIVDGREEIQLKSTQRDQALAYLALVGDWVSRDRLGFLFWADTPDQTARHNVRQLLKRIRRLDWLIGLDVEGENVRWQVPTDVAQLRSFGVDLGRRDRPKYGVLLPGLERGATFEFEEWLLGERRRVLREWKTAVTELAETLDREGRTDEALDVLESALTNTDDETMLLLLMDLAARVGDRQRGIDVFQSVTERIRADLGVEPSERARAMFQRLREADSREEDELAAIVGRAKETEEILGLLAHRDCRLLTLLGPGGIGKSTLARVAASRAAHMFANGSALISVESISDPGNIPSAIAAGLGIRLDSRIDRLDQLVAKLRREQLLLVVDNVEHLPEGWVLLSKLERACRRLKIMVTSRERLRLEDEWVYEVEGLSSPEAAELLLQRGRRVAPAASISDDEAAKMSRAVGGSPLGIELAVPWLRVMSPEAIVDDVLEDPALLRGGSRDSPSRHRSLEAAMAHSWRLLSQDEKETIEALAVFVAPYTRELANEVAPLDDSLLRDLTDKSLISHRGRGLYASHPLVRQYAASRLASDSRRRSDVRARHARAVLGLLDPPEHAIRHREHLDDIIEGWRHALDLANHQLIARSVDGFGLLLDSTGRINQGLELLGRTRSKLDDGTSETRSIVAALEVTESRLLQRRGRHLESAETAREAVSAAAEADSPYWLGRALVSLAWARKWTEGHAAQHETLLEALPVARSLGDELLVVDVLRGLGCSAPELEQCRDYLTDALERSSNLEQPIVRCHVLSNLGSVVWGLGEIPEAMSLHQESLDLARNAGVVGMVISALVDLAFVYGECRDLDTARRLSDEAESMSAAEEFVDLEIRAAQVAGEILRLSGDRMAAQERVLHGLRLVSAIGDPPFGLRSLRLEGQLLIDDGRIEEGLKLLALVRSWTQRGPDFTGWILDPRIWDESVRTADPAVVERAANWAARQGLGDVVESVLAEIASSASAPIGHQDFRR